MVVTSLHPAPSAWSAEILDRARLHVEELRDGQHAITRLYCDQHVSSAELGEAEARWQLDLEAWDRSAEAAALAAWKAAGCPRVPGLAPELVELLLDAASWS